MLAQNEPFGNKWMLNYGSYIVVDPGETATLFATDGAQHVFVKDANGHYQSDNYFATTLTQNSQSQFEMTYPDGFTRIYGVPSGTHALQNFLLKEIDSQGRASVFHYDSQAKMTHIEDSQGRNTRFTYNLEGLVSSVTDPFGRSAHFEYDSLRNLIALTDMQGYTSRIGYDEMRFITFIEDAKGRTQFYIEPADGINNGLQAYNRPGTDMWENYRITVTDPLGGKEEYYFDGYAGTGWYIDQDNYVEYSGSINNSASSVAKTKYFYVTPNGSKGEMARIDYPDGSYVRNQYYKNNKLKSVSTERGLQKSYIWNDKGLLIELTDALGNKTTISYAENGIDPISVTSAVGTSHVAYDDKRQLTSVTNVNGNVTRYEYNAEGKVVKLTDATGQDTQYHYNALAQLQQVVMAGKVLSQYQYDEIGRIKSVTDLLGLTSEYKYNGIDTLVETRHPGGRVETRTFATCPRMMDAATLPGERTYQYEYDSAKQLTIIIDPMQGTLKLMRNKSGQITQLTDQDQNKTQFVYDKAGQLTEKVYADESKISFSYDKGRIRSVTNARGVAKTYQYNDKNQLVSVSYGGSTPSETYRYDLIGRLASVIDGIG